MATYLYQARSTATDQLVQGTAEAESVRELVEQLRQVGYVPLSVRSEGIIRRLGRKLRQLDPIRKEDLAVLYRQLATMIQSGLTLILSLEVIADQGRNRMRKAVTEVHRRISRGEALWEAMARCGAGFSEVHIGLIRAGEQSGKLDEVLDRLATMEEREAALRGKVRSAMSYPVVIMTIAIGVLTFMMVFVVPNFIGIFKGLNADLPFLTQMLLGFVSFMGSWWYIPVGLILALGLGLRQWYRTPNGRRVMDSWVLRLPVVGKMTTNLLLGRLARSLTMLVGSGLPLLEALETSGQVAGNALYREAMAEVAQAVNRGESLAEGMRWTGRFPPFVTEMVRVGEQTGALEMMLEKVAEYYDRQAEEMASKMTAVLEPVLLLVVGGMVGFIVISLFMPMFSLINAVDKAF